MQHIAAVAHQKRNAKIATSPPSFKLQPAEQTFDDRIRRVKAWKNPIKKNIAPTILHPALDEATHGDIDHTTTTMINPTIQAVSPNPWAAIAVEPSLIFCVYDV
mmetsp:Transcript_32217/g.67763  ORF Transcript_32217/g.67763 Transcript_32217/m.67763 type:complete len:104 (-) Transcript_32217:506-817(-)